MKAKSSRPCGRATLKNLSPALYDFGQEIRTALRVVVDAYYSAPSANDDDAIIRIWACCLGVLLYDVGGSVLLLLAHGELRAPTILNRSLFEYQIRLRYYAIRRDKAKQAILQMPERFRKILRVLPPEPGEVSPDEEADFREWLHKSDKIERERFKDDLLKTVLPDMYEIAYDGYYGKASGHVHGYEIVIRDVLRDFYHGKPAPQIDYKGRVFPADDSASVCIHHLLEGLAEIERLSQQTHASAKLESRWDSLTDPVSVVE